MNNLYFVLALIMMAESGGQKLAMHPDGASYGLFGLTEVACIDVGEKFPPDTPKDELRVAKAYLEKMNDRWYCGDDWFVAAGFYHGGDAERREKYVAKLIDLDVDYATNRFNEVFRQPESDIQELAEDFIRTTNGIDPIAGAEPDVIAKLEKRLLQLGDALKEIKNRK